LLVLHGNGGSPRFLPAMRALSEKFDVIIPEAPGFGGSEAPPWLETVSDLANFYLDFLEKFDLHDVHLVGLTLGGWIAADIAVRDASRLASLTLMDAPGIAVPGIEHRDAIDAVQTVRDTYFDPKLADDALARAFNPANDAIRRANESIVEKIAGRYRNHDPLLQRWLHRIRFPTLILWGENDRILPLAYGEAWHKAIAGSRLVALPRCGHLPIQERPEAFAATVAEFCAES
jgi:pimeloyl-ACP methyl ester carboxylesterase